MPVYGPSDIAGSLVALGNPALPASARRVERVAAPLRDQVLDLLRREIVELRLLPGQRLIERELIEGFGVSRSTIREVLNRLEVEGLVAMIPQRGTVVATPSAKEAAELYEVRALLEGAAAKRCAENASEERIADLHAALADLERLVTSGAEARTLLDAKNRLFGVLIDGAGNATIRSLLATLQARIAVLRVTTMSAPGRPPQSLIEIRAIIAAIAKRDPLAAEAAAALHVREAARTLEAHLEKLGADDG